MPSDIVSSSLRNGPVHIRTLPVDVLKNAIVRQMYRLLSVHRSALNSPFVSSRTQSANCVEILFAQERNVELLPSSQVLLLKPIHQNLTAPCLCSHNNTNRIILTTIGMYCWNLDTFSQRRSSLRFQYEWAFYVTIRTTSKIEGVAKILHHLDYHERLEGNWAIGQNIVTWPSRAMLTGPWFLDAITKYAPTDPRFVT